MPDPPKHIEIQVKEGTPISKKDVKKLIQRILYKFKEPKVKPLTDSSKRGQAKEKNKKFFLDVLLKKEFLKVVEELEKKNEIFILDKKGEDLRKVDIPKNCVFVLGDHKGCQKKSGRD